MSNPFRRPNTGSVVVTCQQSGCTFDLPPARWLTLDNLRSSDEASTLARRAKHHAQTTRHDTLMETIWHHPEGFDETTPTMFTWHPEQHDGSGPIADIQADVDKRLEEGDGDT